MGNLCVGLRALGNVGKNKLDRGRHLLKCGGFFFFLKKALVQ